MFPAVSEIEPVTATAPVPDEGAAAELLAAAQRGDVEAFGEVCRIYESRLLRQAVALCHDVATAEELTQDTWVAAWNSLSRFSGGCRFFTWLCAILIHRHKSQLRAKRSWMRWFISESDSDGGDGMKNIVDGAATPASALEIAERDTTLRNCLQALPEKQREVVFLRFYVGESLDGIAVALNCSVGTVKSRLFNALANLRKMRKLTEPFREHSPQR